MLPPVEINLGALAEEFQLTSQQFRDLNEYVVHEVTAEVARNWDNVARQGLNSTRDLYRRSLVVGDEGPFVGYVMLTGQLPNMIEGGASAWDMKIGFSQSNKVKYNKKGEWYLTIPFRWATPSALGENSAFSGVLPVSVYKAIRKTSTAARTSIQGISSRGTGLQFNEIPAQHRAPKSRAAFSDLKTKTTFAKYRHKTSLYQGIVRSQKTYEKATQGQYTSFRRVSKNSSPLSWIHRGLMAKNFAQQGLNDTNIEYIVDKSVDDYLAAQGF